MLHLQVVENRNSDKEAKLQSKLGEGWRKELPDPRDVQHIVWLRLNSRAGNDEGVWQQHGKNIKKYLKMRLLENFSKLCSSGIIFCPVVERIQDLCDQLDIVVLYRL